MKGSVFARRLLAWYDREQRVLPWRGGVTPYETLLSELMLQQTVVATVIPYFERFRARFPDLAMLARATEDDVMRAWAGLGYYSRARNLHRAAREVEERFGGLLPQDEATLRTLPGVGEYTAAAVAAIAFGVRTFALDGNAARVIARVSGDIGLIDKPPVRARLRTFGQTLVPRARAGDFAQAVMELGARVCVAGRPRCESCPVARLCAARARGLTDRIPARTARARKRSVRVLCVAAIRGGKVLLRRRHAGELLGGTWSLPSVEIPLRSRDSGPELATRALAGTGLSLAGARRLSARVHHVFTHLDVTAQIIRGAARGRTRVGEADGWAFADADERAVSSFTRKLFAALVTSG